MCSVLSIFLVCFGMISCLSHFFPFFSFLKKMYNCIIIFISFYFVPLEKKLKRICVETVKYVVFELGQVFCSLLKLSFLAIVI